MKFTANDSLDDSIEKFKSAQKWGVLLVIVYLGFMSVATYYRIPSKPYYISAIVLYIALFVLYLNQAIVVRGRKINRIIKSITISEHLIAETYSYKFLNFKLETKIVEMDNTNSSFNEIDFPYKTLKLRADKAIAIKYKDGELFLLYDYFPIELKEQLL